MKDMPALLAEYLTVADPDLAVPVFGRVIDNGCMLRTFVQIMRSGQVGRMSLGSRPKRLVQRWLEQASMPQLIAAATGSAPSLADIVRMVHPKSADATREAFYDCRPDALLPSGRVTKLCTETARRIVGKRSRA